MFSRGVLGMLLVGIIVIGIYPGPLVNVIEVATGAILP
jgi:NADH:ubiquinone oxidoreductase subunit 4 (subunit M)